MKKVIGLVLALILLCCGCTSTEEGIPIINEYEDIKVLRVAVNQYFLGTPLKYIIDNGWDVANGLKIEMIVFPSGVGENVAILNGEADIAMIGGAFVFGVTESNAKVIAEYIYAKGGNEIFVRKDSPILDVRGFNPTYPDVYGDPDTVAGKTILLEMGTTAQLLASRWLETIGVNEDRITYKNLDFESTFDSFRNGEGDVAVLVSPYVGMAEDEGYMKVAGFEELHYPMYEVIMASEQAYENQKDELATFIALVLLANERFEANSTVKIDAAYKWYQSVGNKSPRKFVAAESRAKTFITPEMAKDLEMGEYEERYALFMARIGKLDAYQVEIVRESIKTDILEMALDRLK